MFIAAALLALAYQWPTPGRDDKNSTRASWTVEDSATMMIGGPDGNNTGKMSVFMAHGFPADAEPPPQWPAADVHIERSEYKAAWHEAIEVQV